MSETANTETPDDSLRITDPDQSGPPSEQPAASRSNPLLQVVFAIVAAAVMALITALAWSVLPVWVATTAGADDEVALVFFLVGPPSGLAIGALSGFLVTIVKPSRRSWRRYAVLLALVLAIGVLLGLAFSDYECGACM